MKIFMINCSPKAKNSASEYLLEELGLVIKGNNEIEKIHVNIRTLKDEDVKKMCEADVLVFSIPLYVDAIPSHIVRLLERIELYNKYKEVSETKVYSIINCGFYEGHQSDIAMEVLKNWCVKAKMIWGCGIGIGCGPMLESLKSIPIGKGPKKNIGKAINYLADNINNFKASENMYISPNFPRFIYMFLADRSWEGQAKENGLKKKNLFRKYVNDIKE